MNNNTIKWLILTCTYAVSIFAIDWFTGVVAYMSSVDRSYLCYGIWGLLGFGMVFIGVQCMTQPDGRKLHFKRVDDLCSIAQILGLLGTVIGLAIMFSEANLTEIDVKDQEAVKNLMGTIVMGLGTAFYTTITGIVVSLMLWSYKFLIAYHGSGFLYVKVKK